MAATAKLQVIIEGSSSGAQKAIDGVGKSLGTLGKFAAGAVAGGVAAVGGAAILAAKDFVGFEQQMREVFTLMPDISGDAMKSMTGDVKDFAAEFGVLPEEVVPALYQSISAGVPADNVFDFLETAQKAAAGGVTDLTTAVDGISSVVNAYGQDVISAGEASDFMFTAVKLGKTNMEELSGSMSNVTPIASSLGVNFGDITAALATMTSQGVSTSQSTTQLRQLMVELSKAGTGASNAFQEVAGVGFAEFIAEGNNVQDALAIMEQAAEDNGVALQDMFSSVEAGSAALALTGSGAESFRSNLEEMASSAGATDAAFETMDQGIQATLNRLKATGKVALLDFADAFSPILSRVAQLVEDMLPRFRDFISGSIVPAVERFAHWINVVSGAVGAGGLSMLFTVFEDGSSFLGGFIELLGVGEAQAQGIAASILNLGNQLGAFLAPLIEAIGQFVEWKDVMIALGAALAIGAAIIVGPILLAIAKISLIIAGVIAVVALLRNAWENNWGGIQEKTRAVISFIQNTVQTVMSAVRSFWEGNGDSILSSTQQVWGTIQGAIQGAINAVRGIIESALNAIQGWWNAHGDSVMTIVSAYLDFVQGYIQGVIDAVQSIVSGALSVIQGFWDDHGQAIGNITAAAWSYIQESISNALDFISAIIDAVAAAIRGDWTEFGEHMRSATEAFWNQIKNLFETAVTILTTIVSTIIASIQNVWTNTDWAALGRGVIDGIVNAITSGASSVANAVTNMARAAVDAAKGFLGIQSPSVVFAEIGRNLAEGLIAGIQDMAPDVEAAIESLFDVAVTLSRIGGRIAGIFKARVVDPLEERLKGQSEGVGNLAEDINERLSEVFSDDDIDIAAMSREQRMEAFFRLVRNGNRDLANDILRLNNMETQRNQTAEEFAEQQERLLRIQEQQQDLQLLQAQQDLLNLIRDNNLSASILDGLELGLDADLADILDAMSRAMQELLQQTENELGIASPSKKFVEIGQRINEGLIKGLQMASGTVSGIISGSVTPQSGFAAAGAGGPAVVFERGAIDARGAERGVGDEIARKIREELAKAGIGSDIRRRVG